MTAFDQEMADRMKAVLKNSLSIFFDVKYPEGGEGALVAEIWFEGEKIAENDIALRDLLISAE